MRGLELRENAGIIGRQFLSFVQSALSLTFLGPHGWQSETRYRRPPAVSAAAQKAECVQLRSRPRGRATRGFIRSFCRTRPVRHKRVAFVMVKPLARSFRQRFVPLPADVRSFRKCDSESVTVRFAAGHMYLITL